MPSVDLGHLNVAMQLDETLDATRELHASTLLAGRYF
jgi:hypothetical protein